MLNKCSIFSGAPCLGEEKQALRLQFQGFIAFLTYTYTVVCLWDHLDQSWVWSSFSSMCSFIHSISAKWNTALGVIQLSEGLGPNTAGRNQAEGSVACLASQGQICVGLAWLDTSRVVLQKSKLACPLLVRTALHVEENLSSSLAASCSGLFHTSAGNTTCLAVLAPGTLAERGQGATKPSKLTTKQPTDSHRDGPADTFVCLATLSPHLAVTKYWIFVYLALKELIVGCQIHVHEYHNTERSITCTMWVVQLLRIEEFLCLLIFLASGWISPPQKSLLWLPEGSQFTKRTLAELLIAFEIFITCKIHCSHFATAVFLQGFMGSAQLIISFACISSEDA